MMTRSPFASEPPRDDQLNALIANALATTQMNLFKLLADKADNDYLLVSEIRAVLDGEQ
jgi:hypothetical protein